MVIHTCDPGIGEAEVGGHEFKGQPGSYKKKPYLKQMVEEKCLASLLKIHGFDP